MILDPQHHQAGFWHKWFYSPSLSPSPSASASASASPNPSAGGRGGTGRLPKLDSWLIQVSQLQIQWETLSQKVSWSLEVVAHAFVGEAL